MRELIPAGRERAARFSFNGLASVGGIRKIDAEAEL